MSLVSVNKNKKPAAATLMDIYTVPAGVYFNGKVIFTEQAGAGTKVRISIAPLGVADSAEQYIEYDTAIAANAKDNSPVFDLVPTDVVRVYSLSGSVSFTLVGLQKSASAIGSGITVAAADGTPSYASIATIQFDEADGFVLSNPSAGVAQINFSGGSGSGSFFSIAKWGRR